MYTVAVGARRHFAVVCNCVNNGRPYTNHNEEQDGGYAVDYEAKDVQHHECDHLREMINRLMIYSQMITERNDQSIDDRSI